MRLSTPGSTADALQGSRGADHDEVGPDPVELDAWLERVVDEAGQVTSAFEARAEIQENRLALLDRRGLRAFQENRLTGVGVRVWIHGASGYASCHDSDRRAVARMVQEAVDIAESNARLGNPTFPHDPAPAETTVYRPGIQGDPLTADVGEIVDLMERALSASDRDDAAYVRSQFGASKRRVLLRNGAGRQADTETLVTTLLAKTVHREGGRLADGTDWISGERGLDDFRGEDSPETLGERAAHWASEAARAVAAPAGRQRVLCDNALSGLLAHESFGHLTEADLVAMGWSTLEGRLGQRFAEEGVTVTDAPEVPGSPRDGVRVPYDEEGTRGRPVHVLEDGVLQRWMHVRGSAQETGHEPQGNGRALSVRFPPIVRMRNTYFEPGDLTKEEALEQLGDGVYLIHGGGGSPASDGSFMFKALRGYRVEGGEIAEPIRGTSVSGNILDFLAGIEGVTRDFNVTTIAFGGCGKWSQSFLPVGIGGPHVLVNDALVGGEQA